MNWFRDSTLLEKAIVISIISGMVVASALVIEMKEERGSSLYIYPASYTNYPDSSKISFVYGVKSYERKRTGYDLEIFIGSNLVDRKHFELNPAGVHEENETLEKPDFKFPIKVKLVLKSPFDTYDVYFWLKKSEETPVPVKTPLAIPVVPSAPASNSTPVSVPTPIYDPTSVPILIDTIGGFSLKEISIRTGDSIKWVNHDQRDRKFTLMSKESLFTVVVDVDKRFEYKFNTSGTFTFYLKEFPSIKETVTVG